MYDVMMNYRGGRYINLYLNDLVSASGEDVPLKCAIAVKYPDVAIEDIRISNYSHIAITCISGTTSSSTYEYMFPNRSVSIIAG